MTNEEMAKDYAEHNQGKYTNEFGNLYHAFLAGIEAGKDMAETDLATIAYMQGAERYRPKWHKVADGDLPKGNCENILLYNKDHFCVTHSYSLGYYENGVFYNDCEMEEDTIAWCEIPRYKE